MKERLDKFLSKVGVCSRSDVPSFIRSGQIFVNGEKAFDKAQKIETETDEILFCGEKVFAKENVYIMMNKAQNYVSSNKEGIYESVFSLLPSVYRTPYYEEKLHIVGRLDVDTEGFLLFTTDGKLTHYLISPKNDFAKKYLVRLKNDVSEKEQKEYAKIFLEGVFIGPYKNEAEHLCKSATIFWQSFNECVLSITEGKYHQVKRMFLAVGNEVTYLKRLSIGPVSLDENLKPGECRELTFDEIESLKRA